MNDKERLQLACSLKRIEEILFFQMLLRRQELLDYVQDVMGRSFKRTDVFLMLDGKTSVSELARKLHMKRPNVSIELRRLRTAGLVEVKTVARDGTVYQRKEILDLLGIPSEIARRMGRSSFDKHSALLHERPASVSDEGESFG